MLPSPMTVRVYGSQTAPPGSAKAAVRLHNGPVGRAVVVPSTGLEPALRRF